MSEHSLSVAGTHWERDHQHRWRGHVDESWYQGRALFGGLLAGILADTMERHQASLSLGGSRTLEGAEPSRPIRSLTVQFVAPAAAGALEIETEHLRAGRYVSQTAARLRQGGTTIALALATFGRARTHPLQYASERMPEVPAPDHVRPLPAHPGVPVFASHIDLRFCCGARPFSGAETPRVGGWCRLEDPQTSVVAALCILLDAWPPPSIVMNTDPSPAATIDMTYHFLPQHLVDVQSSDYFLFDSNCPTIQDGYAEQLGEMWSRSGNLVARVRQMVAIF